MNISAIDATHLAFKNSLSAHLSEKQIYSDPLSRYAYGTDASFYRYVPQLVIRIEHDREVALILNLAHQHQVGLTFRAAGTSLSGQSCSESVLVLLGNGFQGAEVLENGEKIKLKPMVLGGYANQLLAPFGRKIGPDPATINVATVGGIVANNASGMCCGTRQNSYHTLDTLKVILADGSTLDTADPDSIAAFKQSHASFLSELKALSDRIKTNPELAEKVRYKYRMKNTTGYGINALIDFDDPVQMLAHLMIGSEGTLGFISEVTYQSIFDYQDKASAFVFFHSLDDCARAVTALRQRATVEAVELFDAPSIRCVANVAKGLPDFFYSTFDEQAACLLIETRAENQDKLKEQIEQTDEILSEFNYAGHTRFQTDTIITDQYWNVRKGLLPIVASGRPKGANMLTEDIVFPIERLADGIRRLGELFQKYRYYEGMVMGHALEGNLHFILTPLVDSDAEIKRYNDFMQEMAQMIALEFQGSLKGEHGTGRNIAPFVRTEWGDDAYQIMCDIKNLFDPDNILNPDVIISDDENLHLKAFKTMPEVDDTVDACMECGLCEQVCPSSDLTLTPRQRISVYRRIKELGESCQNPQELHALQEAFQYQGIDSCTTTGMCATRCPLGINTGALIKKIKPENRHTTSSAFAERNIATLSQISRVALKASHMIGVEKVSGWSKKLHEKYPGIPIIPDTLPQAAPKVQANHSDPLGEPVVYFVSCVNRTVAEQNINHTSVAEHTLNLFKKSGFRAIFPKQMNALCCGQPFASANLVTDANRASVSLNQALLQASNHGEYPVYLDNSPCALRVKEAQEQGLIDPCLQLFDAASFLHQKILPKLQINTKIAELALHIPCTATKMGVKDDLLTLAQACAHTVTQPDIACCGFAGNKGFFFPELNENALKQLKSSLPQECSHGVSMSKTCQIGLTSQSGIAYQSIEALLDQCSV